jgi:hypothetical protein
MKCREVDKQELNLNNETIFVTYFCSRMYNTSRNEGKDIFISLIARITNHERLEEDLMRRNNEVEYRILSPMTVERDYSKATAESCSNLRNG